MAHLEDFDSALEKALSALAGLGISLKLRSEQKEAVTTLLSRQDLLAVPPLEKPHFSVVGAGNLRAPRFSSTVALQIFTLASSCSFILL